MKRIMFQRVARAFAKYEGRDAARYCAKLGMDAALGSGYSESEGEGTPHEEEKFYRVAEAKVVQSFVKLGRGG